MKLIETHEVTATVVETDDPEWPTFKRYSKDSWENLMGESWETVFGREEELEAMYQDWMRSHKDCKKIDAEYDDRSLPFPHDSEVTWCEDSIGGTEVEYVRSDLVRAVMPANWQEDEDWVRLVMAMGGTDVEKNDASMRKMR